MGRHVSARGPRSPIVLLASLLVVTLVGWLSFEVLADKLGGSGCDSRLTIDVAVARDMAPIVEQAALEAAEIEDEGCYHVDVIARDSEKMAEALVLSGGIERPDVWIPESTMWLRYAQHKGAWDVPVSGTSIATTPVVLAATDATAGKLGWPAENPSWADILGPQASGFTVGFADPAKDPASFSALIALRGLASESEAEAKAYTTLLREVSANAVESQRALYARLPGNTVSGEPLDAFPTSEFALLRHNLQTGAANLVAVYPKRPIPALNYPYVILPGTGEKRRAAAADLLNRLVGKQLADVFAAAGFRTPQGRALRDRSQDNRVRAGAVVPGPFPDPREMRRLLNEWAGVTLSARIAVLLDVSGSMAATVPGTGKSRMALTLRAAELGLKLFKPTTKIGVWLFSTPRGGDAEPYRELLAVEPVREHLADEALRVLRGVIGKVGGGTALYDSTLAVYRDAKQHWAPGRINVVVVMTDGKNEYPAGVSRQRLLAELAELRDPRRPLQIITIGIGPEVDKTELEQIAAATGGESFVTKDPTKIGEVFYKALSGLLCQPPACKPDVGN